LLDKLPDVEFVVVHQSAVRNQGEDGQQNSQAAQDHGPGLGTETEAADLHFRHFFFALCFLNYMT